MTRYNRRWSDGLVWRLGVFLARTLGLLMLVLLGLVSDDEACRVLVRLRQLASQHLPTPIKDHVDFPVQPGKFPQEFEGLRSFECGYDFGSTPQYFGQGAYHQSLGNDHDGQSCGQKRQDFFEKGSLLDAFESFLSYALIPALALRDES